MKPGISVIICTYNGAALLPDSIRHIAQQQVRPGIAWEVIIVNNASTDNTADVVLYEWSKYKNPVPFTLLYQPKKGLTHARELALEKAQYEFVLFCDDDNWLNPAYVEVAYDTMSDHPAVGVLGGHGELVFEADPPLWAIGFSAFACGAQATVSGKVRHNAVYGAGCVIRNSAYKALTKAGFKSMLSDRTGAKLSTGGDYELSYAIALAGYEIWYDARLRFKHYMPKGRVNLDYCTRFFMEGSSSFEVLIPYRIRVNMNCKNSASFNTKLLRVFIGYIKKLLPLLLERLVLEPGSERALVNKVKLLSLKHKLLSFRNYTVMKHNFTRIIKFEKESLYTAGANNEEGFPHKTFLQANSISST